MNSARVCRMKSPQAPVPGEVVEIAEGQHQVVEETLCGDAADGWLLLLRPSARWVLSQDATAWCSGHPKEIATIFPPLLGVARWTDVDVWHTLRLNAGSTLLVHEPSVRTFEAAIDRPLSVIPPNPTLHNWFIVVSLLRLGPLDGF